MLFCGVISHFVDRGALQYKYTLYLVLSSKVHGTYNFWY